MISVAAEGLVSLLAPATLAILVIAATWGILAGALPGMTATAGVALTLPFTLTLEAPVAVATLMAVLSGAMFGNAIPAILIRTPGTPSALLTAIEGYAMHARGDSVRALRLALGSSTVGQILGTTIAIVALVPVARVAIRLLNPEIFALCVLGMAAAAGLLGRSPLKGIASAGLGLIFSFVGSDPLTGFRRYTFGSLELSLGFNLIAVLVGLLSVGMLIEMVAGTSPIPERIDERQARSTEKGRRPVRHLWKALASGVSIGTFIGAVPGAGANISSFIAYENTRLLSRQKEEFGQGSEEALVSVESAQNAGTAGELIPTLAMGIPGSAAMAVVLAGLLVHGVQAGPLLTQTDPEILGGALGGLLIGALLVIPLGTLAIRPFVRLATGSQSAIVVAIFGLTMAGVFSIRRNLFDLAVALFFGAISWLMVRNDYPLAPAALAFVLGGIAERALRSGLVMTRNDMATFLSRPYTAGILLVALAMLLSPQAGKLRRLWRGARPGKGGGP